MPAVWEMPAILAEISVNLPGTRRCSTAGNGRIRTKHDRIEILCFYHRRYNEAADRRQSGGVI